MDEVVDFIIEYNEENGQEWISTSTTTINGKTFVVSLFKIKTTHSYYYCASYLSEVDNDYYLTIDATYWNENPDGGELIEEIIASDLKFD